MDSDTTIQRRRVGYRSLSEICGQLDSLPRVARKDLNPGDQLIVETRNSRYSIWAWNEGQFLVSGGWFDKICRSPTKLTISGCTWGGNAIHCDILAAPGLFLEFGNRVRTTRIQRVTVIRTTDPPIPQ